MFINYTNHPSSDWSNEQCAAARELGDVIVDVAFPNVDPDQSGEAVALLAEQETQKLLALMATSPGKNNAVLCQGEMSLCFAVTERLLRAGIPVLCAVSERQVTESVTEDGAHVKHSVFRFRGFREYRLMTVPFPD